MTTLTFRAQGADVHTTTVQNLPALRAADLLGPHAQDTDSSGLDVLNLTEIQDLNLTVNMPGLQNVALDGAVYVLSAAAGVTSADERETFWAWVQNLGRNVLAYGDQYDIARAFRAAYITSATSTGAYLRETLGEAGVQIPGSLAKFIDWDGYARSERDETFVPLSSGHVGIFNPDI